MESVSITLAAAALLIYLAIRFTARLLSLVPLALAILILAAYLLSKLH